LLQFCVDHAHWVHFNVGCERQRLISNKRLHICRSIYGWTV
jgi:hypothetical protein